MSNAPVAVVVHVPNVWQTCEWYRQVLGIPADLSPDATSARLLVAGQWLAFVAYDAQTNTFGPRRLNSFLTDPPAFHLDVATSDVQQMFDRALDYGAVSVLDPVLDARGKLIAGLCDLNGILIQLSQMLPTPQQTSN